MVEKVPRRFRLVKGRQTRNGAQGEQGTGIAKSLRGPQP